jgi:uncharacterized damage-inducible protein DinB
MLVENYAVFARYNAWMNDKIYTLAAELSDEERKRDLGAFFGSVHGTLNHLLLADRAWLTRFTGDRERFASYDGVREPIVVRSLAQELYADFDELWRQRRRTDADTEAWVASLDDAALAQTLSYKTSAGVAYSHPTWWGISHFFNHQTHHRGQVTTLLNQLGKDPGVTDLIAFMRESDT